MVRHRPQGPALALEALEGHGIEPQHEGWLFTGRRAVLGRIVTWLEGDAPGVLVVTGSPGCGKSAVVRHIAALSNSTEREELFAHASAELTGPDPGVGAVDAFVDLCGMDEQDVAVALAGQLGLPTPRASWQLIADMTRMASPPTLVLDGLDDALPEHLDKIATELLVALATVARLLLTTHQQDFLWCGPPSEGARVVELDEMFGPDAPVIDLDDDSDAPGDIEGYVARRLRAGGRGDLVAQVAPVLAGRAVELGGFLYGRILTSQILRGVVDVSAPGWQWQVATTVGGALDHELATGPSRVRDGAPIPGAARDLLHALAWSHGHGMPRVVWAAAATALSANGVEYGAADLDWVLDHYGCHVVEDEQDGETTHRLCHQELAEHLTESPLPLPGSPAAEALADALMTLPEARPVADGEPDRRSPYLRRHLVRHASIAGRSGVDALCLLAGDTPEAYLPELATSMHQLATKLAGLGEHETALVAARQAVSTYRLLAEANPATWLPFLAMVLNDYAVYLSAVGQREAA
ncbi:MAG: ABC transporter ATP-binding protein, partial [Actinomycetota bacterium]|nr:ABC transporter ATP-binding protein [Actinomycetota bacterium]